jgi:stage II sporulation protein D
LTGTRHTAAVLALACAVLLHATSASGPPAADDAVEQIRVAVGRFKAVDVDGVGGDVVVVRGDGKRSAPAARARFTIGKAGLEFGGAPFGRDVAVVEGAVLKVSGHSYRGVVEVRYQVYDKKPELLVVHPLDLETYVTGIVSAELPKGWPLAAYQAQAVAARTFALQQKMRRVDLPYHMEASVLDQVYGGIEREHALAEEAAQSTRGLVLSSKRHLAQTYFHAACGGQTESAREGWGTPLPYLPGSQCNKCTNATRHSWSVTVTRAALDRAFQGLLGESVERVSITAKTASGRAKSVTLAGKKKTKTITGADFRRLLGWNVVWSTQIDKLTLSKAGLVVDGRGSGHGVGLCQWGARGFALAGKRYQDILATYYPDAPLTRLY